MATNRNTIKSWFLTNLFPKQAQFHAWIDAFWHKDDEIPIVNIDGLNDRLDQKLDIEAYQQGTARPNVVINGGVFTLVKHPTNNDPELQNTLQQNDYAMMGLWDATELWVCAQFIVADITLKDQKNSWKPIRTTKELTTI